VDLAYRIVDVFSARPLAGNQLCVVSDPVDDDELMLAVAREVNLSETTFFTVTGDRSYDVRIWTPTGELPFAGHPSLGTAWTLGPGTWTQRSAGATVEIEVKEAGAVMTQPDPVFSEVDSEEAARGLSLPAGDAPSAFVGEVGGTRYLIVPTTAVLDNLVPHFTHLLAAALAVGATGVAAVRRIDSVNLHVRVFIPGSPVPEDPGTGSAAGPIGILARRLWSMDEGILIHQGVEMGRPCLIEVMATPGNVRVGGAVSACATGRFTL
jgi:trans-2,3-dihydro-3-hydroxyanthranilate isomerase